MDLHPLIERKFNNYQEQMEERTRVAGLERRVKEQEKLIALLEKQRV